MIIFSLFMHMINFHPFMDLKLNENNKKIRRKILPFPSCLICRVRWTVNRCRNTCIHRRPFKNTFVSLGGFRKTLLICNTINFRVVQNVLPTVQFISKIKYLHHCTTVPILSYIKMIILYFVSYKVFLD